VTTIFGGSFNPIHNAHLEMARQVLVLDPSIIFAITKEHAFSKPLPSVETRRELVEKAVKGLDNKVSIQIMEKYTWDFMQTLPEDNYKILIGSDNLVDFHKWKNYEDLLENYEFFIANRGNKHEDSLLKLGMFGEYFNMEEKYKTISSSLIRQKIKDGESIVGLVPDNLIDEIKNVYEKLGESK